MAEEEDLSLNLLRGEMEHSNGDFVPPEGLCWVSVTSCLLLACSYVGSLYVWRSDLPRWEKRWRDALSVSTIWFYFAVIVLYSLWHNLISYVSCMLWLSTQWAFTWNDKQYMFFWSYCLFGSWLVNWGCTHIRTHEFGGPRAGVCSVAPNVTPPPPRAHWVCYMSQRYNAALLFNKSK